MGFEENFKKELENDIIEMHNDGLSENEIAKTLRQSLEQIADVVWRYYETNN